MPLAPPSVKPLYPSYAVWDVMGRRHCRSPSSLLPPASSLESSLLVHIACAACIQPAPHAHSLRRIYPRLRPLRSAAPLRPCEQQQRAHATAQSSPRICTRRHVLGGVPCVMSRAEATERKHASERSQSRGGCKCKGDSEPAYPPQCTLQPHAPPTHPPNTRTAPLRTLSGSVYNTRQHTHTHEGMHARTHARKHRICTRPDPRTRMHANVRRANRASGEVKVTPTKPPPSPHQAPTKLRPRPELRASSLHPWRRGRLAAWRHITGPSQRIPSLS